MKEYSNKSAMEVRFGMIASLVMAGMVDYDEVMKNIPEWEAYVKWGATNNKDKEEKRRAHKVLDLLYDMRKEGRREGLIR